VRLRAVTIESEGLRLAGILHLPDAAAEKLLPAFIVLHGFGGSKDAATHRMEAELYASLGYAVLRFDFRGCGASEGERGRILCQSAVADTKNALTWLAGQPEIDPTRIAISGQSYGAAIGVYTAGIDERVAAVISLGGWGNGLTKFRGQHRSDEAWASFTAMLEEGKRTRAQDARMMVSRWDIVPIPEHLRTNLPPDIIMEFPVEVAQSMVDFRAEDVVANIAPRPLLLLHAANDSVTPSSQSIAMMQNAGAGAELMLLQGMDHFPFAEDQSRIRDLLRGWLDTHFPLTANSCQSGSSIRAEPRRQYDPSRAPISRAGPHT
jgi:dipeptidyl aminopeptidase/acylaminoacyl peptidase